MRRFAALGLWLHPLLVISYLRSVGDLPVMIVVCYGHVKFNLLFFRAQSLNSVVADLLEVACYLRICASPLRWAWITLCTNGWAYQVAECVKERKGRVWSL